MTNYQILGNKAHEMGLAGWCTPRIMRDSRESTPRMFAAALREIRQASYAGAMLSSEFSGKAIGVRQDTAASVDAAIRSK